MSSSTALAHPNIAFVKYWGNRDPVLRIPASGSISMNLGGLHSITRVTFDPSLESDRLSINGKAVTGPGLDRVTSILDHVRRMAGLERCARIQSTNNFPTGAGIASSASAFAALSLAASTAAGLELSETELSRLARRGSGSACRSIPGGFVEWQAGEDDESSYATSIAPPEHWDLVDCIAVVSSARKATGSTEGHALASTSPLQAARVAGAPERLARCREAILRRDFAALADTVELDSNLMHAVMITSSPPLLYWQPATLAVMKSVQEWRRKGFPACYSVDAGPNVHVIAPGGVQAELAARLQGIRGVQKVIAAHPGGPAQLVTSEDL